MALIAGQEDDIEVIRAYEEAGFITPNKLMELLGNATRKGNVELAAYLLEVNMRKHGAKAKSVEL
jgi:hypothetical protein